MDKTIKFTECLNNPNHTHEWDEDNLNVPQLELRIESMVCDKCIEMFRENQPTKEELETLYRKAKQMVLRAKTHR